MNSFKLHGMGIVEVFNVLSKEECEQLILRTEELGYDSATVNMGNDKHIIKPNLRNNSRVNIVDTPLADRIWNCIKDFMPKCVGEDVALSLDDTFRCYRYVPGEYFQWHVDGSTRKNGNRSKYTVLIYLNDDYEGGETEFEHTKVKGKVGSILLFPHKLLHQGATLIKGTKYAIRSDAMYEDHKYKGEPNESTAII